MVKVIVDNDGFLYADSGQRGAGILEVLLVMAIMALLAPFIYNQISDTTREIGDIADAKKIILLRESALNFVRLNQEQWPDTAQIKLSDEEVQRISSAPHAVFVDKYMVRGAIVTDVYMAFNTGDNAMRAARIAKHIGNAAATVGPDGIAYGASWAVSAPDFMPGDLIYRINYNFSGDDNSKYLHRGTSGEDDFNVMYRNLNMGRFDVYGVGTASAQSGAATDTVAAFAESPDAVTASAYFTGGANMDGGAVGVGAMRVTGDITGFRNITAGKLNRVGFTTDGTVISDRATIANSINVGKALNIKSSSVRTISGFAGLIAHSLATPYVYADEISFQNNFGLTVSGELLMSTTAPIRIGSWTFPSANPPRFLELELTRAAMPAMPIKSEFDKIMSAGWRDVPAKP